VSSESGSGGAADNWGKGESWPDNPREGGGGVGHRDGGGCWLSVGMPQEGTRGVGHRDGGGGVSSISIKSQERQGGLGHRDGGGGQGLVYPSNHRKGRGGVGHRDGGSSPSNPRRQEGGVGVGVLLTPWRS